MATIAVSYTAVEGNPFTPADFNGIWPAAVITLSDNEVTSAKILAQAITNAKIANGTIDLTTKVTGALPIANGGTGQVTRTAAFDGLAPASSVAADILTHDGSNWVRLPKGTALQVLRVNSGATGLEWAAETSGMPGSPSAGDIIYYNGAAWVSLAKGTAEQPLKMNAGATAPEWGIPFPASPASGDVLYYNGTSWISLPKGTALQFLRMNAGATAPEWAATSVFAGDVVIVEDQRSSGTDAGTFTAGSWQTRPLNTEVVDTGSNASVASNQITLAAGTYRAYGVATTGNAISRHQLRLRNITDGANLVLGVNTGWNSSVAYWAGKATLEGRFTIADTKVLELQHRCESTAATVGMGAANSFGDGEVYAQVVLIKE